MQMETRSVVTYLLSSKVSLLIILTYPGQRNKIVVSHVRADVHVKDFV